MGAVLERIEENLAAARNEGQRVSALNQIRLWFMLRHTGMRGGEVRALPLAHISADAVSIRDVPDAGFRIKGRKEAILPLAPALKEFLGADISGRGPYERWYLDTGNGQLQWADTTAMARPFSRHFAELGFDAVKPLHGFRASVATLLLNQGASPVLVMKLLRHSSISTTMSYHNPDSLDVSRLLDCL
jgi:integrase